MDVVRSAVEESLKRQLPNQQWNGIWTALQNKLAYAFYTRGKQVLDVISALMKGDGTSGVRRNVLSNLVEEALSNVIDEYVAKPQKDVVLRAFQDAFLPGDKHGAFEWLASVAGRFAATCTLGLPSEVASTLTETLKKMRCFFDTDVVVSYLCAHRVRVESITGTLEWYEVADLESAFTREFMYLRLEGKVRAREWHKFIRRYAGEEPRGPRHPPNTTKMRRILSGEALSIRALKDGGAGKEAIETALYEEAMRHQPDANTEIASVQSRK